MHSERQVQLYRFRKDPSAIIGFYVTATSCKQKQEQKNTTTRIFGFPARCSDRMFWLALPVNSLSYN